MSKKRWEMLRESLEEAKSVRGELELAWVDYRRLYANRMNDRPTRANDPIQVNIIQGMVDIMVASGRRHRPKVNVKPRRREDVGRAKLVEQVIAYWWDRFNIQEEISLADRDAKIYGIGWVKTTWQADYQQLDRDVTVSDVDVEKMMSYLAERAEVLGPILESDVRAFLRQKVEQKKIDQPMVRRVSPWDVWQDPQATSFQDIRWVCQRYWMPIEAARKEQSFSRAHRGDIVATAFEEGTGGTRGRTRAPSDPLGMAEIWELWDVEEARKYNWASGQEQILHDDNWPYVYGQPFLKLGCYKIPDDIFGMGLVEKVCGHQMELNRIRQSMDAEREAMKVKYTIRDNDLTPELQAGLQSDEDRLVIPLRMDAQQPLAEVLHQLPTPQPNPELYRQNDLVKQEAYEVSTVNEFQLNGPSTVRSATEVNAVTGASTARAEALMDSLNSVIVGVARNLIGIGRQFLTSNDVVAVTGMEEFMAGMSRSADAFMVDGKLMLPFGQRDITGEFDFAMEPGSAQPDGDQIRLQKAVQFFQMAMASPVANQEALLLDLAEAVGKADPERFVMPMMAPPPPGGVGMPSPTGLRSEPPRSGLQATAGKSQELADAGRRGGGGRP